jgi:hypothetical protein
MWHTRLRVCPGQCGPPTQPGAAVPHLFNGLLSPCAVRHGLARPGSDPRTMSAPDACQVATRHLIGLKLPAERVNLTVHSDCLSAIDQQTAPGK